MPESYNRRSNGLAIAAMVLTVVVSVAGAWVSDVVITGKNQVLIKQLVDRDSVNAETYSDVRVLKERVDSLDKDFSTILIDVQHIDDQLDSVEINAARSTVAIENLAEQIKVFAESNNRIIVELTKRGI